MLVLIFNRAYLWRLVTEHLIHRLNLRHSLRFGICENRALLLQLVQLFLFSLRCLLRINPGVIQLQSPIDSGILLELQESSILDTK